MSGFEYNGFIHRDLEPQVRYDAEQVQALKQANIDINNKIDALPLGGEKVALTSPAGASSGTITAEQLAVLQANESNYIEMVNDKEIYTLSDNGHEEGFLTYSHVGIENSQATIKTLTITVSAKSFVIVTTVVPTESGGGKLYRHDIYIEGGTSDGAPSMYNGVTMNGKFYSTSNVQKTLDDFWNSENLGIYNILRAQYGGSILTPSYTYTILSKESKVIGLYLLTAYSVNSSTDYGYSFSPKPETGLTEWTLTDTVTEV